MSFIISITALVAIIGLLVGIVMLFKKSWRKKGIKTILGSIFLLVIFAVFSPSRDDIAQKRGFESAADQKKAQSYNITDAAEWNSKKGNILEQERIQQAAIEKAEADKKQKEMDRKNAAEQFYAIPANEQAFIDVVQKAKTTFANAENDLQKGATRRERAKAVCQAISSSTVSGWVGTIEEMTSNSEGLGVLSVKLTNNVVVKTWNNALSDVMDNTLIDPDTAMYKTLSSLKKGTRIKFSGNFIDDDHQLDCYRESSLTLSGSMTDPEYVFRFNSISVFVE